LLKSKKRRHKRRLRRPKFDLVKILLTIDKIIEHKLFKPVSVSIIASYLLFYTINYLNIYFSDFSQKRVLKPTISSPIKINISEEAINFGLKNKQKISRIVKRGDTILSILLGTRMSEEEVFAIRDSIKKVTNSLRINAGDKINFNFRVKIDYQKDESGRIKGIERSIIVEKVEIPRSIDERIVVERLEDGSYNAKIVKIELIKSVKKYSGTINDALYIDMTRKGASATSVMNLINLYSYDVDFQRDIKDGDKFEILTEEYHTKEGERVKDGNILYSSLTLRGRKIEIYMFDNKGQIGYYNPSGYSIRKSLLRTPINGARISSKFGMRRHPVLGYSKMHKGVDFAAPTGTPILAAGDGIIVKMGRNGGYGNYVRIKHNSSYSTAYAHASRFNKKFRSGSRVKQGDVIAYVGSTGRSTGPHLHFELLQNGRQINPSSVKITSGDRLGGSALARFKDFKYQVDKMRKNS